MVWCRLRVSWFANNNNYICVAPDKCNHCYCHCSSYSEFYSSSSYFFIIIIKALAWLADLLIIIIIVTQVLKKLQGCCKNVEMI